MMGMVDVALTGFVGRGAGDGSRPAGFLSQPRIDELPQARTEGLPGSPKPRSTSLDSSALQGVAQFRAPERFSSMGLLNRTVNSPL